MINPPRALAAAGILLLGLVTGCRGAPTGTRRAPEVTSDTLRIPLTDMGTRTYRGYFGGLYPGLSNTPPPAHAQAGVALGRAVQPLDERGNPSPIGKYVLLSVGMSNTTQEFSAFQQLAAADPVVNHGSLVLVDGALGARTAEAWASPTGAEFDRVRDTRLAPLGLSERQVQVAWIKVANAAPTRSLPDRGADATRLVGQMATMVRAMRARYPNLRQVFLSSRIYAGYATTQLNPEPFAYESGFAVKWLVQASVNGGSWTAGPLSYPEVAPWLAWGPYLWAAGTNPRSDGLVWERGDFAQDGIHPSANGRIKVARLLLNFFKGSPFTRCWFVRDGTCG